MNDLQRTLVDLKVSDEHSFKPFHHRTRDRSDVSVLRCEKSGVILLDRSDHVSLAHYHSKIFTGRGARSRAEALAATEHDSERRKKQFRHMIEGKRWLDIGAGAGGVLDALSPFAKMTVAVEPQDLSRQALQEARYEAYALLEEVPEEQFDVITLFHVFEHLAHPIETLRMAHTKLVSGGSIIVEVPHAGDLLYMLDCFKSFSLWSEHLILHTPQSLRAFLGAADFQDMRVQYFQRYPFINHLNWFLRCKPGGHKLLSLMNVAWLNRTHAALLSIAGKTDTIIAVARK